MNSVLSAFDFSCILLCMFFRDFFSCFWLYTFYLILFTDEHVVWDEKGLTCYKGFNEMLQVLIVFFRFQPFHKAIIKFYYYLTFETLGKRPKRNSEMKGQRNENQRENVDGDSFDLNIFGCVIGQILSIYNKHTCTVQIDE